jgi:hypothetical protein
MANKASLTIAIRYIDPSQTQKAKRYFRICKGRPSLAQPSSPSRGEIRTGLRRRTDRLMTTPKLLLNAGVAFLHRPAGKRRAGHARALLLAVDVLCCALAIDHPHGSVASSSF